MIVEFICGLTLIIIAVIAIMAAYRVSMARTESHTKVTESMSIVPCTFSIGDRIRLKGNVDDHVGFCIVDIREGYYWCDADITIPLSKHYLFEKFD